MSAVSTGPNASHDPHPRRHPRRPRADPFRDLPLPVSAEHSAFGPHRSRDLLQARPAPADGLLQGARGPQRAPAPRCGSAPPRCRGRVGRQPRPRPRLPRRPSRDSRHRGDAAVRATREGGHVPAARGHRDPRRGNFRRRPATGDRDRRPRRPGADPRVRRPAGDRGARDDGARDPRRCARRRRPRGALRRRGPARRRGHRREVHPPRDPDRGRRARRRRQPLRLARRGPAHRRGDPAHARRRPRRGHRGRTLVRDRRAARRPRGDGG